MSAVYALFLVRARQFLHTFQTGRFQFLRADGADDFAGDRCEHKDTRGCYHF